MTKLLKFFLDFLLEFITFALFKERKVNIQKETRIKITRASCKVAASYSPAFAVPSALQGLTSLFVMVRGGALVL